MKTIKPHLIFILLLLFFACRQNDQQPPTDRWAAYRKAYELLTINKDSAFLRFNQLAESPKDKQIIALAFYNMAHIQSEAGDHFGAEESLTLSLRHLDVRRPEDQDYLATVYNELSMTAYNLGDYDQSLESAEKALRLAKDKGLKPYILNNAGNAGQKLKKWEPALKSYAEALSLTDPKTTEHARTLTNSALTKWLRNTAYNAAPELLRALAVRQLQKDTWGENASYAHLSDFYQKKRPDSALYYARKMLYTAKIIRSPDDELEALQKMIMLDDPVHTRSYYLRYQRLNDSLTGVRRAAKNQFALIRYDVEKNKAENLQLQKANTEKEYQLGITLAAIIITVILTVIWYRKRKQRSQLEADNRIKQERLRLSQKVHDVVANGIYRVMNEVEHKEDMEKEYLLGQLDRMYEQSRRISHEDEHVLQTNFSQQIDELLNSFKSPGILLALSGNEEPLWDQVRAAVKIQLEPALQELMVNMNKHSKASHALVDFKIGNGLLTVAYRDNGIGFTNKKITGKGLQNTENRIRSLGGELTFGNGEQNGAILEIRIPLK